MNAHTSLFSQYIPGRSIVHRLPAGALLVTTTVVTFAVLFAQVWWLPLAVIGVWMALLLIAGVPPRAALPLPLVVWIMSAIFLLYHLILTNWQTGILVAANFAMCIYAARLVTTTQPIAAIVDALATAVRPLRLVGANPEKFALAVMLMVRSIPYLLGSFHDVRNASRARGLERNIFAQVTPVVVNAVAYAHATGEALIARGLGTNESPQN